MLDCADLLVLCDCAGTVQREGAHRSHRVASLQDDLPRIRPAGTLLGSQAALVAGSAQGLTAAL